MSSLSQHALERRQKHVTGTDDPKILALYPPEWGGEADVYYDKISPVVSDKRTESKAMGHWLQAPLIAFVAEKLGVKTSQRGLFRVSKGSDNELLSCTLDATVVRKPEAIEAKYVGPDHVDEWGDEGTDQVPPYVIAQVQHQMYVAELQTVWIPVLLARYRPERRLYRVNRDDELIKLMVAKLVEWWNQHVVARVPPEGATVPPLAILRAMRREPKKTVPIRPELVESWQMAQEQKTRAVKFSEETKRLILAAMGDAEAGDGGDAGSITFLEQTVPAHTRAENTFRVLRYRKPKHA